MKQDAAVPFGTEYPQPSTEQVAVKPADGGALSQLRDAHYRAIVESATDFAIVTTDLHGRITSWNPGAEKLLGWSEGEVLGRHACMIFTPEDQADGACDSEMRGAAERGRAEDERWHLRRDGSRFWASGLMTRLDDEASGAQLGFLKILRDRTPQHKVEARSRESEARFRNMADHAPVMMWVTDAEGACIYLNRRWYEFTGQSKAEAEGFGWLQAVHPDDRGWSGETFLAANAKREPFRLEYRLRHADGAYRWTIDAASPRFGEDGAFLGFIGSVIDVEERRRAEEASRETSRRLDAILANTREAVFLMDERQHCVFANAAAEKLTGYPFERMNGRPLHDVVHHKKPDGSHYPLEECQIDRAFPERAQMSGEELFVAPNGGFYPVAFTASPVLDDAGRPIGTVIEARNIADEKAEAARQRFRLELVDRLRVETDPRAIMAAAVEALGLHLRVARVGYGLVRDDERTVDLETEYVDGVARLAGSYPLDAFGTGNIANLRSGRSSVYPNVEEDGGTAGIGLAKFGIVALVAVPLVRGGRLRAALYVNHDGPRDWAPEDVALIEDVAARVWDAVERARVQDELRALNAELERRVQQEVAEHAKTEEQLRQAQKMEAVGQLTGGIAHDFNNLLTGVIGSLDLMQRRLAQGQTDKVERYATAAMTSANRAAALTHRLLAFARRQPLDPKPVNANRLVTGMEELLRRTIGEATRLEIVTAGGLWQTLCDPHQLESAILNLTINARDAMPNGGQLTIETCNAHLDSAYAARSRDVRPGQYICICVTDTGTGMSADTIAKAFEPFFTTKPIGQGTGLGLSMIYGFARQSEGYAKIYSEVGRGTTIKLYLPRYYGEGEDAEENAAQLEEAHRAEQGEVVLVVEDETTVRDLVVEVLDDLGYRALEAADGPAGLKVLESNARIDLLVTDVGLPGMNGRQLADAARERRPDLRVLFMTGYAENAAIAGGFLEPGMEMITKPFAIDALATRLRDMIEER